MGDGTLELRLLRAEGVPEGSLVSIRIGSERRQAAYGSQRPYRFQNMGSAPEQMKVDVYAPVAHARLLLNPSCKEARRWTQPLAPTCEGPATGAVIAKAGESSSPFPLSVDLEVVAGEAVPPPGEGTGGTVTEPSRPPTEDLDEHLMNRVRRPTSAKRHQAAIEAESYFEQHEVVAVLRKLLLAVIQDKPDDLYSYMIQVLTNSRDAAGGKPKRPHAAPGRPQRPHTAVARLRSEVAREAPPEFTPENAEAARAVPMPPAVPPPGLSPPPPPAGPPPQMLEEVQQERASGNSTQVDPSKECVDEAAPGEVLSDDLEKCRAKVRASLAQALSQGTLQDLLHSISDAPGQDSPKIVEYAKAAAYDPSSMGRTVHLKGFAARVDFTDPVTEALSNLAVDFICDTLNPDTLVWDGDSYQHDSFTALIPRIWHRSRPRLAMFLRDRDEDKARVDQCWPPLQLPITRYLCDAKVDFRELGIAGLSCTQSKVAVCLGGGDVVTREFREAPEDVSFYVLPVTRHSASGIGEERSPLQALSAQNLHHLELPVLEADAAEVVEDPVSASIAELPANAETTHLEGLRVDLRHALVDKAASGELAHLLGTPRAGQPRGETPMADAGSEIPLHLRVRAGLMDLAAQNRLEAVLADSCFEALGAGESEGCGGSPPAALPAEQSPASALASDPAGVLAGPSAPGPSALLPDPIEGTVVDEDEDREVAMALAVTNGGNPRTMPWGPLENPAAAEPVGSIVLEEDAESLAPLVAVPGAADQAERDVSEEARMSVEAALAQQPWTLGGE